jgi:hypothetical protein
MLFYSMSNPVENVVDQLQQVIDKIVNKKGEVGVLHVVDQLTQVIQDIQQKSASVPTIVRDDQALSVKPTPSVVKPTPSVVKPTPSDGKSTPSDGKSTPRVVKPTPSVVKSTPTVGPGEVVIITSRTENSPNELDKDGKVGDTKIINKESIQLS